MKAVRFCSILLLAGFLSLTASAARYYVNSQSGDDHNSGLSRKEPWQSLEKVNAVHFAAGDRILFRAGCVWSGQLLISAQGAPGRPVIFEADGRGAWPKIVGGGKVEDAILLRNAQHVLLRGLEVTNTETDPPTTNTLPRRGVHILAENAGVLTGITVAEMYIHDVRGTQQRKDNGGIVFTTRGERVPTCFEDLRIERNIVWRVDRSGIVAQSYHANRTRWFPSKGVIIRDNWLGDLGGDGITPWATDGCLVEHNIVQGANERAGTYNAGIWPWSTDNTVLRLNRASGVKTRLDGQGFDSDYNSRNTLIEFNLSHDNEGGFLLVCTPGEKKPLENCGNIGTVARYNISRHDRSRVLHMAGAAERTSFQNNAIYVAPNQDVQVLLFSDWSGWAKGLEVSGNLFYSEGTGQYGHQISRNYADGTYGLAPGWGQASEIVFHGNRYVGEHQNRPEETGQGLAPAPMKFPLWPGPQFNPEQPNTFPKYLKAHRAWMLRLMKAQFGRVPQ